MAYHEKLAKLCREGLSKGITIVITALDTKGVTSYLGILSRKLLLNCLWKNMRTFLREK